jgi:hypothetical protein
LGTKLDQPAGLILLTGLEFRSNHVDCHNCGWQGLAGKLKVPSHEQLANDVKYACPGCGVTIAVHNGLTTQEVMQEMQKIREILASETVEKRIDAQLAEDKDELSLSFKRVREQIRIVEPAKEDGPEDSEDNVLDFNDIRARLNIA